MTPELLLTLGGLALVDSLSIGTLLIPLFFLIAPGRIHGGRMLAYLATISLFYFLVGLSVTAGAAALFGEFTAVLASPAAYIVQLVLGAVLLIGSFFIGGKPKESDKPGRLSRWRERGLWDGPPLGVLLLAVSAGVLEIATMFPYLGAIGLITTTELPVATSAALLALYCVVMITPALVALIIRILARRTVEPILVRFSNWLQRTSRETTGWIIGIVGFLLARDAAQLLGLFDTLGAR